MTGKFLTAGAAVLLAGVLSRNASVTSLNLSHNAICGVKYGEGEYDPSGVAALAQALGGNTTLQTLDLYDNHLGVEGGQALAAALEANSTLVSLSLAGVGGFTNAGGIGFEGGLAIAEAQAQAPPAGARPLAQPARRRGGQGARGGAALILTKLELQLNQLGSAALALDEAVSGRGWLNL